METTCSSDKKSYKVKSVDGTKDVEFECTSKGQKHKFSNLSLEIYCSDPAEVCKKHTKCPSDCNFRY